MIKPNKNVEEELNSKKNGEINDYEVLLQKLEAEVRQHIRVIHCWFSPNISKDRAVTKTICRGHATKAGGQ